MTTRKEIFGTDNLITDKEMKTVAIAAAEGTPGGFTEEDFVAFIEWANKARINDGMLKAILSGRILLNIEDTAKSPNHDFMMKSRKPAS